MLSRFELSADVTQPQARNAGSISWSDWTSETSAWKRGCGGKVTGEFTREQFDERLIGRRMLGVLDEASSLSGATHA